MVSGVVCDGSKRTEARPRARETCADLTPGTRVIARSTWETQLAQCIPFTEKSASTLAAAAGGAVLIVRDFTQCHGAGQSGGGGGWRRDKSPLDSNEQGPAVAGPWKSFRGG